MRKSRQLIDNLKMKPFKLLCTFAVAAAIANAVVLQKFRRAALLPESMDYKCCHDDCRTCIREHDCRDGHDDYCMAKVPTFFNRCCIFEDYEKFEKSRYQEEIPNTSLELLGKIYHENQPGEGH